MSKILETAKLFFEACETGRGWEGCSEYCHPDATFSAQAGALADLSTLDGYTEWMKGLFTPVPDGRYELPFCRGPGTKLRCRIRRISWYSHGPRRPH